jgi:hypothetical protein
LLLEKSRTVNVTAAGRPVDSAIIRAELDRDDQGALVDNDTGGVEAAAARDRRRQAEGENRSMMALLEKQTKIL